MGHSAAGARTAATPLATSVAAVSAVAVSLVAACGSSGGEQALGGPGLPVQLVDETYPGERSTVDGALVVRPDGCFYVALADGGELFTIWPRGTSGEGDAVRTRQGELGDRDALTGTGVVVAVQHLAANPYWQEAHLGFCAPQEVEVLVLDDVAPAP